MMQYEASALGVNMSVPYGAWMGSVIEDSFWAPHDLNVEIQDFIANNERLYESETYSEVVVMFSVQSAYDWEEHKGWKVKFPFWPATESLVEQHQPFDVIVLPEGELREDWLTPGDLARYRTVVLPECTFLTSIQAKTLLAYLEHGGKVVATGDLGANLDAAERAALFAHPHLTRAADVRAEYFAGGPQAIVDPGVDLALNVTRVGDKEAAVHIIRYDYDEGRDEVPVIDKMTLDIRVARPFRSVSAISPTGEVPARLRFSRERREMHRVELENVGLYTVVLLQ
jgi:hypothetical protein